MLSDTIIMVDGAVVVNMAVVGGTSLPVITNVGELFFKTDEDVLYIRNAANNGWVDLVGTGEPDQNLWLNVGADSGGSAVANTTTDTLTIAGGTNVTTVRAGDTITINASGGDLISDPSPQLGADLDTNNFTIGDADDDTKMSFGSSDDDVFQVYAGENGASNHFITSTPIIEHSVTGGKGAFDAILSITGLAAGASNVNGGGDIIISAGAGTTTDSAGLLTLEEGGSTNRSGAFVQLNGSVQAPSSGTNSVEIQGASPSGSFEANGGNIAINAGLGRGAGNLGGNISIQPGRGISSATDGFVVIQNANHVDTPQLKFRRNTTGNAVALAARNVTVANDQLWRLPDHGESGDDNLGIDLGEFTVANLPTATNYKNCWALTTDVGSPNTRTVVRSDGTNWKAIAVEGATVA